MRRRSLLMSILCLTAVPLVVGAADDPLRAFAERLGGSVYPAEADQPVTQLNLNNSQVTDADLAALEGRSDLQVLYLRGTAISDAGLAHLISLTGLYQFDLSGTKITDAGLEHLAGMKNLAGLQLADTAITDDGLALLSGLTTLRSLKLKGTAVTTAGVETLRAVLPTARIDSNAGLATGAAVAAEVKAAQAAMQRPTPKPKATANDNTPSCTDLSDVNCLKAELSSGVPRRCTAATNAIANVRNERMQRGEVGADQALVEATAAFLFELAQKEGDRCQGSGFTGLDWLGPGIREVLPPDEVVPFLIATIEAGRAAGRFRSEQDSALRILPSFGADAAPAVPMLSEILAAKDDKVTQSRRPDAVQALGAIGGPARSAEPLLFAAMADQEVRDYRDLDTRKRSAEALLAVGTDQGRVAEALVPWLVDDERDLKIAARRLLIEIGEPAAVAVAPGLSSTNEKTMGAAVDVLTALGSAAKVAIPDAVAAVIATGDPHGYLEMLLGEIGPGDSDAVAALAAALDDDDERLQARAASILGTWGPAAGAALPALRRLADSDSSSNWIAKMAIEDIEGGGGN